MKTLYTLYYLEERDFSENPEYADRRKVLQKVEGDNGFTVYEEAVMRVKAILEKKEEIVILEVFSL